MENDPFVDDFPIEYAECPSHTVKLPEGIAKTDAPHQHVEKWPVWRPWPHWPHGYFNTMILPSMCSIYIPMDPHRCSFRKYVGSMDRSSRRRESDDFQRIRRDGSHQGDKVLVTIWWDVC